MRNSKITGLVLLSGGLVAWGCSSEDTPGGTGGGAGTNGAGTSGSGVTAGTSSGGAPTAGTSGKGGSTATGGSVSTGGTTSGSGGSATAGTTGGAPVSGSGGTGTAGTTGGSVSAGTGGDAVSAGTGGGGTGGTTSNPDVLTVQLAEVRQIIRGFGINATIMPDGESLPWSQLFTLEGTNALGLSILRIGMNENGGHRSVPSDWTQARTLGAKIIGSCWTAPATWKKNTSTTGGGELNADRYDDWATQIADYAADNDLYAMSIGNETDFASCSPSQGRPCNPPLTDEYESMVYTGKQLAAFVKVAGPIFEQRAPNVKMIAPEASLWIHVWSNLSPTNKANGGYDSSDPLGCGCFSNDLNDTAALANCNSSCTTGEAGYDYGHWLAKDQEAWDAFDILGVHEYESQIGYAWPADVTGGVRTKEIWQTEMSGVMYWPEQGPSTDINNGIAVAKWIHSALTVGEASAWLYWWYKAYYQDDNEGLALTKNGNTIAKRYYTMGNFSRYIRPDVFHAVRVAGPAPAKVYVSAYLGDDGKVVVVAINETNAAVDLPIAITGGTAPASMLPYVTSSAANWMAGTAAPVTDGSFQAALPATSVTTYVSQ